MVNATSTHPLGRISELNRAGTGFSPLSGPTAVIPAPTCRPYLREVSRLIRWTASGEPRPVVGYQPRLAEYPVISETSQLLFPTVTSWKA
jgi:hypothetical protein